LPTVEIGGLSVPVATGLAARLLGLAALDRHRAGPGLLIPRCASVHTFGMRFALNLVFVDRRGRPLAIHRGVGRRRVVAVRGAWAVLELSSPAESEEFAGGGGESADLPPG